MYASRQSQLFKDLKALLDLKPSTLNSRLLSLPRELRGHVFDFILPENTKIRPELHTCLWGADMAGRQAWKHDVFGYGNAVPSSCRLQPYLLLINKQLRQELLQNYFRRSKLTLHAELRNMKLGNDTFEHSPHIL